ncbi:MAG: hypothetical protein M4579_000469 [Chaenotheca gracillima]|nr:MAG: hypothetical protein M4579_000469 [Chaenotheca gracillima]
MDLSWMLGHSKTSFYHSDKSLELKDKSGSKISLAETCEAATPPCRLNPFLFNGHLQTFWTVMKHDTVPIYYRRKIFSAESAAYAGTYAVDFVVPPFKDHDESLPPRTANFEESEEIRSLDDKPMLVALHGLSGGSHELYLRHVLAPLVTEEGGWEACVINSRGCAESKITTGVLYNARATWDARQTIKWLRETFPNRPLFGIGFSLGANILTNYLGEEGSNCILKAAVVCSNPWNLEIGSKALQRTWLGLEVYSKTMGNSMRALFEKHVDQIRENSNVDIESVRKVKYLHEFDRELQTRTWGYPTVDAYYRDASSSDSVLAVKIPLFAIHAEDDPIAVNEATPVDEFRQNPYTVMCKTATGGHLGWFEFGGSRWFAKPAVNFLNKMARDMDIKEADGNLTSANGTTGISSSRQTPDYDPMRRRLNMHIEKA